MNGKNMIRPLAVAAFCLGMTVQTNAAHATAGFWIYMDCHGVNGLPDWSHTPNTITTSVQINGDWLDVDSRSIPDSMCDQDNAILITYLAFNAFEVDKVRVKSNGDNAFWIDKILLVDRGTYSLWQWGWNDNFGYCVSNQASDGNTPYCIGSVAGTTTFTKPYADIAP